MYSVYIHQTNKAMNDIKLLYLIPIAVYWIVRPQAATALYNNLHYILLSECIRSGPCLEEFMDHRSTR